MSLAIIYVGRRNKDMLYDEMVIYRGKTVKREKGRIFIPKGDIKSISANGWVDGQFWIEIETKSGLENTAEEGGMLRTYSIVLDV